MPIKETPNLKEFLDLYSKDKDRIIFFTGSGLSMPLFDSWSGILKEMVELCDAQGKLKYDKSELISLINEGREFLEIAEICSEALGEASYRDFMEKHFDKEFEYNSIPKAYRELFELQPKVIVTTNYDLIPNVAGKGNYSDFTNRTIAEAARSIERNKKTVVKIHGDIKDQESIVLTRQNYNRIMNNETVKNFLRTIFSANKVLFIGFGLTDLHLDLVLSYLNTINANIPITHYALMPISSQFQVDSLENKYGLKVIPYSPADSSHPEVSQFIQMLAGSKINHTFTKMDSPKEICHHIAKTLKSILGSRSFITNYDPYQRCLYISFETRAFTEYELQKELILLAKTFDFDSSLLDTVIICIHNASTNSENINEFQPIVIAGSVSFHAISNFAKNTLNAHDLWKGIRFFVPKNIGNFTKEMNFISFPLIGAII